MRNTSTSTNTNANNNNPSSYSTSDMDANATAYHAELLAFLRESNDMRTAAKHSVKQGLWAGGGAVAGGLVAGPVGGLVGGVAGSVMGFFQSEDYDGAIQQLMQLPEAQQSRFVQAVTKLLAQYHLTSSNQRRSTGDGLDDDDDDMNGFFVNTPQAFRNTLSELAKRRDVRQELWRLCKQALDVPDDGSAPETVLTS